MYTWYEDKGRMYGMRMYVWGRDVCSYVCMGTFKGGNEGREGSGGVSSPDNPALAPSTRAQFGQESSRKASVPTSCTWVVAVVVFSPFLC